MSGDAPDARDGEIPRLPRGSFFKMSGPQLFRIGMVAILLVMVLALRHRCGDAVAGFIATFDPPPDAGTAETAPGEMRLERLTEDEIKRRFPGGDDAGPSP